MTTVSGSFTGVGVSSVLDTRNQPEIISYSISGTYAATIQLERATTPDGGQWEIVAGPFDTANASVEGAVDSRENDRFRWRCVAYTSGTVTYSVSDGDAIVKEFKDRDGNVLFRYTQAGIVIPGNLSVAGDTTITGDAAITGDTTFSGSAGGLHEGVVLANTGSTQSFTTSTFTSIDHKVATVQDLQNGLKFWLGDDLTFTANASTDELTATSHAMVTGDGPLRLTTSGTLPAGLSTATNYWVIKVDANTIQLATSYANAIAGTQIDITDTGSGTHTLDRASRIVIPGGSGITRVRLTANFAWAANATGQRVLQIAKNVEGTGTGYVAVAYNNNVGATLGSRLFVGTPIVEVSEGDFFTAIGWQNSGGNLGIIAIVSTFGIEVLARS